MNYQRIYDSLIERARHRDLRCYVERHHVIPHCMGGTNDVDNLVELTPEEHYVAHQLLVKIHPENDKLLFAAHMMCCGRTTNKLYGWLRRRCAEASGLMNAKHAGNKNSQFGSKWITDGKLNKKIKKTDLVPNGWRAGRILLCLRKKIKSRGFLITDGIEFRKIHVGEEIPLGWKARGMAGFTSSHSMQAREKMSKSKIGNKSLSGMKWITDGSVNRVIPANQKLPKGWYFGKFRAYGEAVSSVPSKHVASVRT